MEESSTYQPPPTDTSPFSLAIWAQFGFFVLLLLNFYNADDSLVTSDLVFMGAALVTGLLQLFRVKNGRLGGLLLMMAATTIAWGVMEGFGSDVIWAFGFFILPFFGMVIYMPALAFDEYGMDIPRSRRKGLLIALMLFTMLFFGTLETMEIAGADGELTQEDFDGDVVYEISDAQVTLAQVSVGIGALGMVLFLATAAGGMALGGLRPWHAVAMGVSTTFLDAYNMADIGMGELWLESLWAVVITMSFVLAAREFFEKGDEASA